MKNTVVRFILSWVELNISTGSKIDDLVAETGYSRKTLEMWFHNYSNITLGEYLLRRKMSRIAILLRMTELSVSELAAMFHFYSSQNLSRSFRNFSGVTPTNYRKQEKWLTEVLQRPLLMGIGNDLNPERCVLPEIEIIGTKELCSHKFLSLSVEDELNNRMQEELRKYREKNDSEISFACRTIPSSSIAEGRADIVNVEVIIQSKHKANGNLTKTIMPSGEYVKFSFGGSWDEYIVFTRLVYFNLAENNIQRRTGFDLIFFNSAADNDHEVICHLFVPVE